MTRGSSTAYGYTVPVIDKICDLCAGFLFFLFPPLNTREENACKRWAVNGPVSTNSRRTRRLYRMSRMQTTPPCCPIPCLIGRLSAYGVVCLVACPPSSSIPPRRPPSPLADARLIDNRAAFPKRTSEHMFPLKGVQSTQSRQSRKGMKPQRTSREAREHGGGTQGRVVGNGPGLRSMTERLKRRKKETLFRGWTCLTEQTTYVR
ncbi:hypothetical protein CTAM01_10255 [Colletotrichum tamarilloi]|uniref:Uncharacterized protein n=1 Tax=Colletotrichum tamarilloi TaxID=1209934 RepID=A0ABQ9R0U7_9PEZI|nr:uncharacterized protein CTAM01_10255 [Colletotrichum tamarilloi]KAK1491529.1 hypothetical protein CTAM01_10255 [Colletotrichum tamarilloi]